MLPHGLFNTSPADLGPAARGWPTTCAGWSPGSAQLRPDGGYRPRLHVDTYGTPGLAFDGDLTAPWPATWPGSARSARPFDLAVEHPVDAGSRDAAARRLRRAPRRAAPAGQRACGSWSTSGATPWTTSRAFVAAGAADVVHVKTPDLGSLTDTVEALLLVRDAGLEAYCGGTCTETDRSAQVTAHVAMACEAGQVLAKPGMGVDEGLMVVGNEMARTAALVAARRAAEGASR